MGPDFVYICFINSDTTEGRGHMIASAVFEDADDAQKWVSDNNPYAGVVIPVKAGDPTREAQRFENGLTEYRQFRVWHDYDTYVERHLMEEERQRALAKLTPHEREILGLK